MCPKPCRYLEGLIYQDSTRVYCAYWDEPLQEKETIKCYRDGWECYEEPSGMGKVILNNKGEWVEPLVLMEKFYETIPEDYEYQNWAINKETIAELAWRKARHDDEKV